MPFKAEFCRSFRVGSCRKRLEGRCHATFELVDRPRWKKPSNSFFTCPNLFVLLSVELVVAPKFEPDHNEPWFEAAWPRQIRLQSSFCRSCVRAISSGETLRPLPLG